MKKNNSNAQNDLAEVLHPQQSVELLKQLHILTREGQLNQDSRRKLKQIYHLYHFFEPILKELATKEEIQSLTKKFEGSVNDEAAAKEKQVMEE